ncbi:o-succinylbenzoate synthase [bacterium SCSIO 12741]|nr:o-succinylbenzoate synthase [bacterium SCSIO 12741]
MIRATCIPYQLHFKRPGGTSRGVLRQKETWFIRLEDTDTGKVGIGETGLFRGLSYDDRPEYAQKIQQVCGAIQDWDSLNVSLSQLTDWPSIRFGLESAYLALQADKEWELFPSAFTRSEAGIPINGLIWMGDPAFMKEQIQEKIQAGFRCLKLKIGALDFDKEIEILSEIRKTFDPSELEIRVDANGAFSPAETLDKLKRLNRFHLHSIEQPIRAGQLDEMKDLVSKTPFPIALDEELIGVTRPEDQDRLLTEIQPQYIILKPALVGGLEASRTWIRKAEERGMGWWITSALESNIGLNAIAQFTYSLQTDRYQGLGTGQLFTNNISSPLEIRDAHLYYGTGEWEVQSLNWNDPS